MAKEEKQKPEEVTNKECQYLMDTPCHFTFQQTEYALHKGDVISLPMASEFVTSLIAQNRFKLLTQ